MVPRLRRCRRLPAAGAWAEMVALLANMAESALAGGALTAAGAPTAGVSGE